MRVAKVIGNIWSTRKEEKLSGFKLLIVQPINVLDGSLDKAPIVAADTIGAGVGETVIVVGGSSARSAAGDMSVPVDATVVGIVDDQEIDPDVLQEGGESRMNLIETVKSAGIVGAGGAGFPTHIKLNTKAEWFIVNAAECEPLIETDKYLCRTFADRIVVAATAVAAHLGAQHIVIALKRKYEPEIAALQAAIDKTGADIRLFPMATFYPAGDEQTMVQLVTGKTVPERGLPIDVGAVVDNVGTLLNIYSALTEGAPVSSKFLSVTGEVREPIMLHVPIGTAITECIQAAGPRISDYAVILGGPMMGKVVSDPEAIRAAVVTKTTGNLLVLPRDHYLITHAERPIDRIRVQARSACIQCRMCTDLCPRYLIGHQIRPNLVMRNLYRENFIEDNDEFLRAFGDAANCCS